MTLMSNRYTLSFVHFYFYFIIYANLYSLKNKNGFIVVSFEYLSNLLAVGCTYPII